MELRDFLTVTPAVPASGEPFVVVFSGVDSICEEQSPISSVIGHRLILDLREENVCSPNLSGFPVATDFRFDLPGLKPGTYQIEFYINLETQTFPPSLGVAVTVPAPVPAMNNAGTFLLLFIVGLLGVRPLAVFTGRHSAGDFDLKTQDKMGS
ncbi:MAG: hypothetical protein AB8B96_01680 [Lysobacterales bacterium]